jgi:hypothetical protein
MVFRLDNAHDIDANNQEDLINFVDWNFIAELPQFDREATMDLDSGASVEPFPSPIGERIFHAALINNSPTTPIWDQAIAQPTVQLSSANQHHRNEPSNTISPQDGAAVENNDSDVNAFSDIHQWESDSAAATQQQLYFVENMHASPRIGAEVALAPVQQTELEKIVRLAVNKAVQQVSVQRADMINALKQEIEELQSKILELTQGDIGSNITRIATRAQNRHVNFSDGIIHIVNAWIENIGSVCYLNAYLQVIALSYTTKLPVEYANFITAEVSTILCFGNSY